MRKILFWLILLIALFLVIVLGVAAKRKVSPRMVLDDWFSRDRISSPTANQDMEENNDISQDTTLSEDDKKDTELFLDSLIQTP